MVQLPSFLEDMGNFIKQLSELEIGDDYLAISLITLDDKGLETLKLFLEQRGGHNVLYRFFVGSEYPPVQ